MVSPSPPRGRLRSVARTSSRMRSRSPQLSRSHTPSRSRSSYRSRSPDRRRRYSSRSPSRSRSDSRSRSPTRSLSRSLSPASRRNGRYRSRSWSRGRERARRERTASPLVKSTKIVVERLTKNINEDHLYEIFGQFGRIKDLDLPMNRTYNHNRGTAYILYYHQADAEQAISYMHEGQIDGAIINVSIVLPRRMLSPAPPMARRGANIDPRVPFTSNSRGGPPTGPAAHQGGAGRRRLTPVGRFYPRSDVYRPGSRSPSRSPGGAPPPRGAGNRYRSRSGDSYSSMSRSRSPAPRRRGNDRHENNDRRRRSPSRSSFDSYDDRSRSRSRGRGYK